MVQYDLTKIEISANGRNVKYKGKAQDKCDLSLLIHSAALQSGKSVGFPLWSDIYWYSSSKKELVDYLKYFLS